MKWKAQLRYQSFQVLQGMGIYCAVIVLMDIIFSILNFTVFGGKTFIIAGGTSSYIVVFAFGAAMYKSSLLFSFASGSTRRGTFIGNLAGGAVCVGVCAIFETLQALVTLNGDMWDGLFYPLYRGFRGAGPNLFDFAVFLLFSFAFSYLLGLFFAVWFYRMKKWQIVTVSVALGSLFFYVVIGMSGNAAFVESVFALWRVVRPAFGLGENRNPYVALPTFAAMGAALAGASWLILRRTPLKVK